ncbi:MAG: glycosyltransferase family 4 protein [Candidatus Cloacimonetes bacterium]|nr:glycosyltransferase family 4 protein [Candidatus Cloacimonadota bacterium]
MTNKILHILAQKPGNTGSGIFLQSLLNEAGKKKYQQSVIAGISKNDNLESCGIPEDIQFFPVLFETEELPFPVIGMSDVMPYQSTRYQDLSNKMTEQWQSAFKDQIRNAVEKFQPDLIISHHLWILSVFIKELFPNFPIFVISHGTGLRQLKLAKQFSQYVIAGSKELDHIFALTEFQKAEIIREYGISKNTISVIGGAYNPKIFYPAKNSNQKIKLVYCGKLSYAKGVLSLIKVFNRLKTVGVEPELILVGSGSGEEEQSIRNFAEKCSNEIKFTGAVSQHKLAEIFRNSDIFVLPSFYEGLGLVVIEALACGLRIVSTDFPGLKEWIGEEINQTGIIKYVQLPRLKNKDIPIKDDLPVFERRLETALSEQIQAHISAKQKPDLTEFLLDKTWTGIFSRIEKRIYEQFR